MPLIAAALCASGCDRQPTGQVAAVVGDDEITLQEINAEISGAQLPKGVDQKAVQQAALERIIDRRLLADVARDDGIDKQPDFLIRQHQLQDALLVQLLGEKAARTVRVPDTVTLDKYIAAHPKTFAQRELLLLDQIRFPVPSDATKLRALEEDHSMAAVASKLEQLGIKFERGAAKLDTAQIPANLLARIQALPETEPFVIPNNGLVTVSVVTGRQSVPLTGEMARPVAVQLMRNEELDNTIKQRLKVKKAETKISYQAGFSPPKTPAAPAKSALP